MGKAVFFGTPAHGHVNPTRAVVRELVNMGEHVTYFCGEEFRAKIESCGASFESYESVSTKEISYSFREAGNIFLLAATILEKTQYLLPELLHRVQALRPDYIIHDTLSVWGKMIATLLHLPAVCSVPTFVFTWRSGAQSLDFSREVISMFWHEGAALWRARRAAVRLGHDWQLKPPSFIDLFNNKQKLNIVYTSEMFQPMAHVFDDSYRFVGASVFPGVEEDELLWEGIGNMPVVYVSMGTIFHEAEPVYALCIEALRNVDCTVVLSVGAKTDIRRLEPVPENTIVRNHVPQVSALGRTSVFITHGGMNSVSESALHGVPMVVIPQGADQFVVADRVQQMGLGIRMHRNRVTANRIREAVLAVLANNSYRENCRRIGDSFRAAGGPRRAADEILRYVANA